MDHGDMAGPQDPHSSSQVATYSEMCMPLFCTHPKEVCGCYLTWMCVCVPLCVCMGVLPAEKRLIRPWEYPLWQHIRTSLSLFWYPPLINALRLFDCSFIVFCPSPFLKEDDVTSHEFWEFRGLPKGEEEKFCVWTKRVETKTQWEVLMSYDSLKSVTGKDNFHPMMELLPEGSNNFQDANCSRSTCWVVSDNSTAVNCEFITIKVHNILIWCIQLCDCVNLCKSFKNKKMTIAITDLKSCWVRDNDLCCWGIPGIRLCW